MTSSADAESDRAAGEVAWFCTECGCRHEPVGPSDGDRHSNTDDLSQVFDRH